MDHADTATFSRNLLGGCASAETMVLGVHGAPCGEVLFSGRCCSNGSTTSRFGRAMCGEHHSENRLPFIYGLRVV